MSKCTKFRKIIRSHALFFGTLGGVLLGIIIGFGLKQLNPTETVVTLISFPGELFIRGLQLLVLPVVIFSLIVGSSSLNVSTNGKIALLTFGYFIATSLFNSFFGILLAVSISPGDISIKSSIENVTVTILEERRNTLLDNFLDLARNLVPNNIFGSFLEQATTIYKPTSDGNYIKVIGTRQSTNALGVITYSILFGIVCAICDPVHMKPFIDVAKAIDKINMKMMTGLICLTPLGVCSIICAKILEVKDVGTILMSLGWFILTVTIGVLIYQLIIMQLLYFAIIRKNPFEFYTGVFPAALTGFAADSSAAALPVSLKCLDENVEVDTRVSRFVIPLGVTINMDGTALFISISSIFIAQINGIQLYIGDYVTIWMASTAVSIAASSAPSASLTLIFIVLNAINVPTSDIGLLFAIDWLVDRIRTTNNVLGDIYTAALVEHWCKKELEQDNCENIKEPSEKVISTGVINNLHNHETNC